MKQGCILFLLLLIFVFAACKKDEFITSAEASLTISADSITFDTVFTTTGSITQQLKIFNTNDRKLLLSSVRLSGGNDSEFRINVDGTPGPAVNNIEIAANDSIYVFITVRIDQGADNLPFIVRDSIEVLFNGNTRQVQLQAWGRNANFFHSRTITQNESWTNEKPFVIMGGLLINEGVTLTIEKGTKVYFHADAPLIVDGTIQVNGERYDSTRVIFQGDRLDEPYRNFPGAWPGIIFRESSRNNELNYAVIRNAYQGINIQGSSANNMSKLLLNQCIVDNSFDSGLTAAYSDIEANNCLFSNNGGGVMLTEGGNYTFEHCTIVSYSNTFILHTRPSLVVTNFVQEGNTISTNKLKATFVNSIIYGTNGTVENEVIVRKEGNSEWEVRFENCLWNNQQPVPDITSVNNSENEDPMFDSINTQKNFYNFRLKENSPAIDAGKTSSLSVDLDGNRRRIRKEDIGCYEKE